MLECCSAVQSVRVLLCGSKGVLSVLESCCGVANAMWLPRCSECVRMLLWGCQGVLSAFCVFKTSCKPTLICIRTLTSDSSFRDAIFHFSSCNPVFHK